MAKLRCAEPAALRKPPHPRFCLVKMLSYRRYWLILNNLYRIKPPSNSATMTMRFLIAMKVVSKLRICWWHMCAAIPATSRSILHCRADAFTWIEMLAKRLLCRNLFANILFDYGHKKRKLNCLSFLSVTPERLELSTQWLRVICSTNWATESVLCSFRVQR